MAAIVSSQSERKAKLSTRIAARRPASSPQTRQRHSVVRGSGVYDRLLECEQRRSEKSADGETSWLVDPALRTQTTPTTAQTPPGGVPVAGHRRAGAGLLRCGPELDRAWPRGAGRKRLLCEREAAGPGGCRAAPARAPDRDAGRLQDLAPSTPSVPSPTWSAPWRSRATRSPLSARSSHREIDELLDAATSSTTALAVIPRDPTAARGPRSTPRNVALRSRPAPTRSATVSARCLRRGTPRG